MSHVAVQAHRWQSQWALLFHTILILTKSNFFPLCPNMHTHTHLHISSPSGTIMETSYISLCFYLSPTHTLKGLHCPILLNYNAQKGKVQHVQLWPLGSQIPMKESSSKHGKNCSGTGPCPVLIKHPPAWVQWSHWSSCVIVKILRFISQL